jgi:hypothetical protein
MLLPPSRTLAPPTGGDDGRQVAGMPSALGVVEVSATTTGLAGVGLAGVGLAGVGLAGVGLAGVIAAELPEAVEVPAALVAVTVNVYAVPLVKPVTMAVVADPTEAPVSPPGVEVTV